MRIGCFTVTVCAGVRIMSLEVTSPSHEIVGLTTCVETLSILHLGFCTDKQDIMCWLLSFRGVSILLLLDRAKIAVSTCFQSLCQAKLPSCRLELYDYHESWFSLLRKVIRCIFPKCQTCLKVHWYMPSTDGIILKYNKIY